MNTRLERVGQLIRDEIADILQREIHDPLIGFVTVTEVEVSADLRHATVYFSVLGSGEQIRNSIRGILRARKHINALLAERLELRYVPKLSFRYDETAARAQRIEALLRAEQAQLGLAAVDRERVDEAESNNLFARATGDRANGGAEQEPAVEPQHGEAEISPNNDASEAI